MLKSRGRHSGQNWVLVNLAMCIRLKLILYAIITKTTAAHILNSEINPTSWNYYV